MNDTGPGTVSSESMLDEIFADVLDAAAAGRPIDRDGLIAAHPHLSETLREFFDEVDWMRGLAGPISAAEPDG